jgi:hypothetical protein
MLRRNSEFFLWMILVMKKIAIIDVDQYKIMNKIITFAANNN